MTKLTPEHEAWRKATAEEYAFRTGNPHFHTITEVYLKGMAAQDEVSRLIGRIEAYADIENITKGEYLGLICRERSGKLEAQLAALLAGGKIKDE